MLQDKTIQPTQNPANTQSQTDRVQTNNRNTTLDIKSPEGRVREVFLNIMSLTELKNIGLSALLCVNKAIRNRIIKSEDSRNVPINITLTVVELFTPDNEKLQFSQGCKIKLRIDLRTTDLEQIQNFVDLLNNPAKNFSERIYEIEFGDIDTKSQEAVQKLINLLPSKCPNFTSFFCQNIDNDTRLSFPASIKSFINFTCWDVGSSAHILFDPGFNYPYRPGTYNNLRSMNCGNFAQNAELCPPHNITSFHCGTIQNKIHLGYCHKLTLISCDDIDECGALYLPPDYNRLAHFFCGDVKGILQLPKNLNCLNSFSCGNINNEIFVFPEKLPLLTRFNSGNIQCMQFTPPIKLPKLVFFSFRFTESREPVLFSKILNNLITTLFSEIRNNIILIHPPIVFEINYSLLNPESLSKLNDNQRRFLEDSNHIPKMERYNENFQSTIDSINKIQSSLNQLIDNEIIKVHVTCGNVDDNILLDHFLIQHSIEDVQPVKLWEQIFKKLMLLYPIRELFQANQIYPKEFVDLLFCMKIDYSHVRSARYISQLDIEIENRIIAIQASQKSDIIKLLNKINSINEVLKHRCYTDETVSKIKTSLNKTLIEALEQPNSELLENTKARIKKLYQIAKTVKKLLLLININNDEKSLVDEKLKKDEIEAANLENAKEHIEKLKENISNLIQELYKVTNNLDVLIRLITLSNPQFNGCWLNLSQLLDPQTTEYQLVSISKSKITLKNVLITNNNAVQAFINFIDNPNNSNLLDRITAVECETVDNNFDTLLTQLSSKLPNLTSISCQDILTGVTVSLPEKLSNLVAFYCRNIQKNATLIFPKTFNNLICFYCQDVHEHATLVLPEELNKLTSISFGSISPNSIVTYSKASSLTTLSFKWSTDKKIKQLVAQASNIKFDPDSSRFQISKDNNLEIQITLETTDNTQIQSFINFIQDSHNTNFLNCIKTIVIGDILLSNQNLIKELTNLLSSRCPNLTSFSCDNIGGSNFALDFVDFKLPEFSNLISFSCGRICSGAKLRLTKRFDKLISFSCGAIDILAELILSSPVNLVSFSSGDMAGTLRLPPYLNKLESFQCRNIFGTFEFPKSLHSLNSFEAGNIIGASVVFPKELNNLNSFFCGDILPGNFGSKTILSLPKKLPNLAFFGCGNIIDTRLTLPSELLNLIYFSCDNIMGTLIFAEVIPKLMYFFYGKIYEGSIITIPNSESIPEKLRTKFQEMTAMETRIKKQEDKCLVM